MPNIVREYLGDKANAKGDRPRLYHNNRDGTFTDVSREARLDSLLLTMGANFGDLDNDGWLDFYLGTGAAPAHQHRAEPDVPQRRRQGASRTSPRRAASAICRKGHAVAFGDIDNTGVQDVFEVIGGAIRERPLLQRAVQESRATATIG